MKTASPIPRSPRKPPTEAGPAPAPYPAYGGRRFDLQEDTMASRDTELNRGLWTLANRALEYKSTH